MLIPIANKDVHFTTQKAYDAHVLMEVYWRNVEDLQVFLGDIQSGPIRSVFVYLSRHETTSFVGSLSVVVEEITSGCMRLPSNRRHISAPTGRDREVLDVIGRDYND